MLQLHSTYYPRYPNDVKLPQPHMMIYACQNYLSGILLRSKNSPENVAAALQTPFRQTFYIIAEWTLKLWHALAWNNFFFFWLFHFSGPRLIQYSLTETKLHTQVCFGKSALACMLFLTQLLPFTCAWDQLTSSRFPSLVYFCPKSIVYVFYFYFILSFWVLFDRCSNQKLR